MNFNYKIAFFITLGLLVVTFISFVLYIMITIFAVMDAGIEIPDPDNCDGEYCVSNVINESNTTNPTKYDNKNIAKVSENEVYQNIDFGFRFDLNDGEKALPCPYPVGDYVSVELVMQEEPIIDLEMACAKEGPQEYISAERFGEGSIGFEQFIYDSYKYTTEKKVISGYEGTRYIGTRLPEVDGPIPNKIDVTVIETDKSIYKITSDFYNRNVYIW